MRDLLADILICLAIACVIAGVALIWVPVAFIVAGVLIGALAYFWIGSKR